jgi:hypothetical protein
MLSTGAAFAAVSEEGGESSRKAELGWKRRSVIRQLFPRFV